MELELGPLANETEVRGKLNMADLFEDVFDDEVAEEGSQDGTDDDSISMDSWENGKNQSLHDLPLVSPSSADGKHDHHNRRRRFSELKMNVPSPTSLDRNTSQGRSNAITEFSIQDFGFFHEYESLFILNPNF